MKRWSEKFLHSICHPDVMESVSQTLPACINFDAKLNRLKANVVLSNFVDRDEFGDIRWDDMVDKTTENCYLNKIRHALDTMAITPMGKDILSCMLSSTHFGVAPFRQTGRFLNHSFPMIFLKAADDVFENDKMILKILAHECMHAKNVVMEECVHAYLLPPRLFFMKCMFNEMSAYLSEDIVVQQVKNPKTSVKEIKPEYVFDVMEHLVDNDNVDEFANRVIDWHKKDVLKYYKESYTNENLQVFAYYFKTHPALCNLTIINRLYQLYNHHVVKKVRRQMYARSHQHSR